MVRYAAFHSFVWLWLVPAVAGLIGYGLWRRQRALVQFVGSGGVARLLGGISTARRLFKAAWVVLAVTLIVVAMAQPQWGVERTPQRSRGRDIFIALDTSRSMLAEDVIPNRLERAKADIRDLIAAVEQSAGHRLGLIAFAGQASVKCPLTQVYGHVKTVLDGLDTRSVARGGTLIGDAIRTAIEAFDEKTANFRDLIIVTDGEDMESFPTDAAAEARDAGVTIYLVGIGDAVEGARIPVTDKSGHRTFLEHDGQQVWSKLDDQTLRDIARVSGAVYIPAGTRAVELDRIFRELIEPKTKRDLAEVQRERLRHRFQLFLAPALLLLMLECLIPDARRVATPRMRRANASHAVSVEPASSVASARVRQSVLPVLFVAASTLWPTSARAEDAAAIVREGNRLYEQGKFTQAAQRYEQAAALAPDSAVPLFNRAAALFQTGDFEQAASLYEQARLRAPAELRQQINYALGNAHLQQALRARAQPDRATQQAQTAVQFYRDAISPSTDPAAAAISDSARYNLEIAKRVIKQIEQQQQAPPERQPDKDQNQQQQRQAPDTQQAAPDERPPEDAGRQPTQSQQARPSSAEQVSPEDAADRLRAAIARAQLARARRLPDRDKKAKGAPVGKDW
jgi:Ca-activated chloride channel family protein